MAVNAARDRDEERLSVPWNITEWVDGATIRGWVEEEIAALDWSNPELLKFLGENPNFRPRVLLTILSYAYSIGNYESEGISQCLFSDQCSCARNAHRNEFTAQHHRKTLWVNNFSILSIINPARSLRPLSYSNAALPWNGTAFA